MLDLESLVAHARRRGHPVVWRDLADRNGELHSSGVIYLNPHRNGSVIRQVLAHELGHAWHGHDWRREHDRERDEREADTYAARILISPLEYAEAEMIYGSDPRLLAGHLGVSARLVTLWQRHLDLRGWAVRMDDLDDAVA